MKGWQFGYEVVLILCSDTATLSPRINVWIFCRIVMKVGINIIYKTDLSNILFVHQQLHFLLNLEKF